MEIDTVVVGDCREVLKDVPDSSVDAVVTDPPYPHIRRDYGFWTTEEWWALIVEGVVPEVRRILKPTGSAVFIVQPNGRIGSMRGWLWEFMAWVCREWNMVQDVYWWNFTRPPDAFAIQGRLCRASVKLCVWCGPRDCFRDQDQVLWSESERNIAQRLGARAGRREFPGGHSIDHLAVFSAAVKRGGVTPFNLLPIANTLGPGSSGALGHGSGVREELVAWWLRYIVPDGGLVVDPFMGVGTTAVAALRQGKHFFGCDIVPEYVEIARKRIDGRR